MWIDRHNLQVAMVWEGKEVIKTGRGLIGATNPLASAPGTIRGDFGVETGRNLIHGSGHSSCAALCNLICLP